MSYSSSSFGPGNIGALKSGIGLTMGPTIGSTDSREAIALGGLGVWMRAQPSANWGGLVAPAPARLLKRVITSPLMRIATPGAQNMVDTNYIDTTPPSELAPDEIPSEEIVPPEDSGGSTWMWVVGGIVGLGLIGGLAWWALK